MKDINILEGSLKNVFVVVGGHTYAKEDDIVYLAKPNDKGTLEIFAVNPEMPIEKSVNVVKQPTKEQYENALLNLIIDDNRQNPSKRGLYSLGLGEIYYEYLDSLSSIKYGRDNGEKLGKQSCNGL